MPVLGEIKVEGTQQRSKGRYPSAVKRVFERYLVIVTLTNFKVTVIGEIIINR
jgi:hypothetical protein